MAVFRLKNCHFFNQQTKIMKNKMKPESLMMSFGYKPELSEGSIKCPIFQTSTFAFKTAEEGKRFFEIAYGIKEKEVSEEIGLIYSRLNNPDLEILENRLSLWDDADDAAVFDSGLAAITSVILEFMKPGSLMLYSQPIYGGTQHFIDTFLKKINITAISFSPDDSFEQIVAKIEKSGLKDNLEMVYVETPANPTNDLFDLRICNKIKEHFATEEKPVTFVVDNTYMGPLWQHPLKFGADLVVYSATKYIGGHSDLIAGACVGNGDHIKRVKTIRTFLGNMAGPWTGWLLMRSLETLKIRMEKQAENAQKVADYLAKHPKVGKVNYLGLLKEGDAQYEVYKSHFTSPGAMLSFQIKGGEAEAFKFLNNVKLMKLAVSLGSTESLAEHPATMTHSNIDKETKDKLGITESLVRLSIGVEDADDLISDIENALSKV